MRTSFAPLAALITAALLTAHTQPLAQKTEAKGVVSFSPQGVVRGVNQVNVRFAEPMTSFGDPAAKGDPFTIECGVPGKGRWIDPTQWAYDFDRILPSGRHCRFTLVSGLTTSAGTALGGPREFSFSTGGPAIVRTDPFQGSEWVNEDQVFMIELDGPVDTASVAAEAYFVVEGLASNVPVRVIEGELRSTLLKASYYFRSTPDDQTLLIQPKQALPAATPIRLVWSHRIKSSGGVRNTEDQILQFVTRPLFTARFQCSRENAESDCIPILPMSVSFSAPVPRQAVEGAALTGPAGKTWKPRMEEDADFIQSLEFEGPFPKKSRFQLRLPGGIQDDAGRKLTNAGEFPLEVATDEYPALAKFSSSFGIIEAGDPFLPVTVRNIEVEMQLAKLDLSGTSEVSGTVSRVPSNDVPAMLEWIRKLANIDWSKRDQSVFTEDAAAPKSLTLPRQFGKEAFEVVGIPLEKPGFYVVELKSALLGMRLLEPPPKPMYVATTALVTNLGVHLKWGAENSLVWVTRLDSGKPQPGAEVTVLDCTGAVLWEGTTDENGLAITDELPSVDQAENCGWGQFQSGLVVVARSDNDMSFVHSGWQDGIEPWRFQLPRPQEPLLITAHTLLDRSLLRAGDTVHMKHLIRKRSTQGLTTVPPEERPTRLVITHVGTWQEYELEVDFDDQGVATSDWTIPAAAKLGTYEIRLKAEGDPQWTSGSFRVEEFKVPLIKATVSTPAGPLIRPRQVPISVSVEFLAGGPARNLPVLLRHRTEPASPGPFADFEGFQFANGSVKEGLLRRGEEREPSPPEFQHQRFELDQYGIGKVTVEPGPVSESSSVVLAELEYRDPNGDLQTVSSRIPLWPSGILVGVQAADWMQKKDSVGAQAAVIDTKGNPLAQKEVTIDAYQRRNYSHRKRLVGGFYAYEHTAEIVKLGEFCRGLSDEKGIFSCKSEAPVSGNLILVASTQDAAGNVCTAKAESWVAGDEDWWFDVEDNDRIDLIPERKSYEIGETARFQVRMPFREATALVTVEREGIASAFVKTIQGNESVVEVPIRREYAPNVFVSALLVRGRVSEIEPTAMVDLGKPAYKLGISEIQVGKKEHQLRVTIQPDKESYQVRQPAKARIQVSRLDGERLPPDAEVAIAVVDEGLLELAPNDSWDLLGAMLGRWGYAVSTSTAQMQVVGKRHFGLKAEPSGGGGGRQLTRELFDTLLLWKGRVQLDKQGKAVVDFKLNDSVTSFRIVAIAEAGNDLFGTGSARIRSTQDLVLYSGLPTVAREGDRLDAVFTLRNATGKKLNARLTITSPELKLNQQKQLKLDAGSAGAVRHSIEVPAGLNSLTLEVSANADKGLSDRMSSKIRIVPAVPVRTIQATLERLDHKVTLPIERPRTALADRGGIAVDLQPTLLAGLSGVRDYMQAYPYSCLEQELSRAVALGDQASWERRMGVLPQYLDSDGLLRFFPGLSAGSEILTAYLVSLGHEAGWSIPDEYLSLMLKGLEDVVEGRVTRANPRRADFVLRKLICLEALSRHARVTPEQLTSLDRRPDIWPNSALVNWVSILRHTADFPNREPWMTEASRLLQARLNLQSTSAGFARSDDRLYWLLGSPDSDLARLVLYDLSSGDLKEDLPRLVRGLVHRQQRGSWDITTANAWGTLALKKFAAVYERDPVTGQTSLGLGDAVQTVDWTTAPKEVQLPWPSGPSTFAAEHNGSGAPWIVVRSQAAVPAVETFSGYRITRSIEPVESRTPGKWSVGDILRVKLTVEAREDLDWVVISDPIPAGAVILGSGLRRDSAVGESQTEDWSWIQPAFVERSREAFRAYYEFLPQGVRTLEYTLRLNASGVFQLPPSRAEALYMPEVFGELPNAPWEVAP